MCLLAICQSRAMSTEEFDESWRSNDHGFGFARAVKGGVYYRKGIMNKEEALAFYQSVCHKLPHVVHFRRASVGGVLPELTHPFVVTPFDADQNALEGTVDSVLLHNGTHTDWKPMLMLCDLFAGMQGVPLVTDPISDTKVMARLVGLLGLDNVHTTLERYLSGRLCVITPRKIIKAGSFEPDENGILFSNTGYRPRRSSYQALSRDANGRFTSSGKHDASLYGYDRYGYDRDDYLQYPISTRRQDRGSHDDELREVFDELRREEQTQKETKGTLSHTHTNELFEQRKSVIHLPEGLRRYRGKS